MILTFKHQSIGYTRNGKMIPCAIDARDIGKIILYFNMHDFSDDDLLDAYALFGYLAVKSKRGAETLIDYEKHADATLDLLPPIRFEAAKLKAGVLTAFDLRKLGVSLALQEFNEL